MPVKPRVLLFAGLGVNCENEMAKGFELAGGLPTIKHMFDVEAHELQNYQIIAFPGGFAYGDHLGAGFAYAQNIKQRMQEALAESVIRKQLILGICNGCQVLTHLGLLKLPLTLNLNKGGTYICRDVELIADPNNTSPWLQGILRLYLTIGHKEGRFRIMDESRPQPAFTYQDNPNGSDLDAAGFTDPTGHILAMMPHPDRALYYHQRADWHKLNNTAKRNGTTLPTYGDGLKLFMSGVKYFS